MSTQPTKPLPQPDKPVWWTRIEKAMDACKEAGVPYILMAVGEEGQVAGGYNGHPEIIRQVMVLVAQRFEHDMARRQRMAPLVAPNGQPVESGQEVKAS